MKHLILIILAAGVFNTLSAQENFITREGYIKFYSHTPIEDITAENKEVGSILNSKTGEVVFTMKMTDFQFEKKLMQEHFNENYVESEKFPKATFKGFITDNEKVDYTKKGSYSVHVKGDMTIHGVTREVETAGTIEVIRDGVTASTKFMLNPEDYDIKIPGVVRNKIANDLEISAKMNYAPMK